MATRKQRVKVMDTTPYLARDDKDLPWVPSGCVLLDCVLGGGYVLGRVVNIVGDRSSGKTLLAIEAAANFIRKYPDGTIRYLEAEAAFDPQYAKSMGMPLERVAFVEEVDTIEGFFKDLEESLDESINTGKPCLYVLDSLDSLSDEKEMARKLDDDAFGAVKAKKISEGFRKIIRKLEQSKTLLIVISQLRDNIGVMFGSKSKRSGGRALDFYASQILWLNEMGKLKRTVHGVERVYGIEVKAQAKKNKVGPAYRDCTFPLLFGYGIDDVTASAQWLFDTKSGAEVLDELRLTQKGFKAALQRLRDDGPAALREVRSKLNAAVRQNWANVEQELMPKSSKYDGDE